MPCKRSSNSRRRVSTPANSGSPFTDSRLEAERGQEKAGGKRIFVAQLMAIPGVGHIVAEAVAGAYACPADLGRATVGEVAAIALGGTNLITQRSVGEAKAAAIKGVFTCE